MTLYLVQLENRSRPVCARWDGDDLKIGTPVVVESEFGPALGEVKEERTWIEEFDVKAPCAAKLLRKAAEEDIKTRESHRKIEREALRFCRGQASELGLQMKVAGASIDLDASSLLLFYTSEKRVDFRELVRRMAKRFRSRIEMRQIGVRDETKLLGGYGHCGCPLCCSSYMGRFYPITIKMAKEQGLSLNPAKISGRCGRLMCCIRHEWDSPGNSCAAEKNGK